MTKKERDKQIKQLYKCQKKEEWLMTWRKLPKKLLFSIDCNISSRCIGRCQKVVNEYYNKIHESFIWMDSEDCNGNGILDKIKTKNV